MHCRRTKQGSFRQESRGVIWLGVLLAALIASRACAAPLDQISLSRTIDRKVALTNSEIIAAALFINGLTNELRGFLYSDQLPSTVTVTPLLVRLNGITITNYSFESGLDGDVYSGYKPWRWQIETPAGFAESNAIPEQAEVRIVYSISSGQPGVFSLHPPTWVATIPDETEMLFGYGGIFESLSLKFAATLDSPLLSSSLTGYDFSVTVDGVPRSIYVLSVSSNLVDWIPVATNLSPFTLTESVSSGAHRFFLGAPYTITEGNLAVRSAGTNLFQFSVESVPAAVYVLERSEDLLDWAPIETNFAPFQVTVTNQPGATAGFFRARLLDL